MKVLIYGAGQNGRIVLEILKSQKTYRVVGFIDDKEQLLNKKIDGVPVIGNSMYLKQLISNDHINNAFVSIGDNQTRAKKAHLLTTMGYNLINSIHQKVIVSANVKLGVNVQITAGVIINTGSKIGSNVIINTAATIDHDNEIGDNVQICPGAHLAGAVKIKEYAFIGTGAVVVNNVTIGENAIVGAGSVILKDIPDNVVVVGVPGKICQHR
jgi:sugar O-acyltransferase (sialic acid O-acetyltransferase NeuD family)